MHYSIAAYSIMAISAGLILSVQSIWDVQLKTTYGGLAPVSVMAFSVALVASLVWAKLSNAPLLPSCEQMWSVKWYQQMGGLGRFAYLLCMVWTLPKLGPCKTFCLVVTTQVLTAAFADQFGWFGVPIHKLTIFRWLGIGLLVTGIYMVSKK